MQTLWFEKIIKKAFRYRNWLFYKNANNTPCISMGKALCKESWKNTRESRTADQQHGVILLSRQCGNSTIPVIRQLFGGSLLYFMQEHSL